MSNFRVSVEYRPVSQLQPYTGNARTHSKRQLRQIADSIERFGFTNPILVSDSDGILAGHGRVAAAKLLGIKEVPTVRLSHLSEAERRAYILADNKLALNAGWDSEVLAIELQALADLDFGLDITGFSIAEVDLILEDAHESAGFHSDAEDQIPAPTIRAISRLGDMWELGRHRLLCGDARDAAHLANLLSKQSVDLIFTDPPYNVPIDGNVCGSGRTRHREFAMGTGEMSAAEFTTFLVDALRPAAAACRDGAIAFVCMDWRHIGELLAAGKEVFSELKNLCVWNKTNGGMGTFYRSKHELVFVFKVGTGPHVNSFGLGDTGRYRTNVWDYAGISSISASRAEELAMHPTCKPVSLVADAIKDCSKRGAVVLDVFGGSGTTLIAAQKVGRSARLMEIDPLYCDTIIRRFIAYTGQRVVLCSSGIAFEEIEEVRCVTGTVGDD